MGETTQLLEGEPTRCDIEHARCDDGNYDKLPLRVKSLLVEGKDVLINAPLTVPSRVRGLQFVKPEGGGTDEVIQEPLAKAGVFRVSEITESIIKHLKDVVRLSQAELALHPFNDPSVLILRPVMKPPCSLILKGGRVGEGARNYERLQNLREFLVEIEVSLPPSVPKSAPLQPLLYWHIGSLFVVLATLVIFTLSWIVFVSESFSTAVLVSSLIASLVWALWVVLCLTWIWKRGKAQRGPHCFHLAVLKASTAAAACAAAFTSSVLIYTMDVDPPTPHKDLFLIVSVSCYALAGVVELVGLVSHSPPIPPKGGTRLRSVSSIN
eukprot:TRINITY_DN5696_c0_g1_i1.p1 TRINITY_DN5696_c0_g1~~TRINITY_DN5696_c0_g1_i1.p1  ORF type:complete len:324 (+),score=5.96 TRINITY_DN5696_c0_g1_i1:52-1023(+)